jgi:PAS domain S-box-containing protein
LRHPGAITIDSRPSRPNRLQRGASALLGGGELPILALVAALFATVYALRLASSDPRDGMALLYALPIAIVASRFGLAGGLAAAAIAALLTLLDGDPHQGLPLLGYLNRFLVFGGIGAIVGWFIDREKATQRAREEAQAKVRRFFELSKDLLCTASDDGRFRDVNPAWERTLGYSLQELQDRGFIDLVHPDDRERTEAEAGRIFDGEGTADFENRYLDRDGEVHWLHWSSQVGSDGLVYARATDVTERHRADHELREIAAALERSNDELKQFAYIASHDLGEPLRTISGFAQLLQRRYEDQVDERGREYIERMVGGVGRMQTMIADLLAFSRAGRAEIERQPVEAKALVEEVVESLGGAISEAGAEVQVGELPEVEADRNQLQQLFQNLIANALKFNDSGHPRVEVSGGPAGDGWRFSVRDNGIGIAPEQRERIFGAFQRLHSRDEYEGSGIGLAICKKIVERHGGEISVGEGLDGRGVGFAFTIGGRRGEQR